MKTKLILVATLALNAALAALLFAPRGNAPAPVPHAAAVSSPKKFPEAPPATTNITTPVIPFHWRQIESEDYRRYIANLRAIGCPERLIRDIIFADLKKLYESRERNPNAVASEPWVGADRREAESRQRVLRREELRDERRALVRELLGSESPGSSEDEWNDNEVVGLLLGFLPEGVPAQLMAATGRYQQQGRRIREETQGIFLDEDFAKLEALNTGLTNELAALLAPADFEELRLRGQIFKTLDGDRASLEGVELAGQELREIMRASLVTGDIFREIFDFERQDLPAGEKERREAEFEQKVAQILGPERYGDYQLGKDRDYREAFKFAREKKLPKPVARTVGRAMAGARAQLAEIKTDKTLTPAEREAAIIVLAAATRNSVAAALGAAAAEYLKENGGFLPGLVEDTKQGGKR